MTIQTPIHPTPTQIAQELLREHIITKSLAALPELLELEHVKMQIDAQKSRSAALARLRDGIRGLKTAPIRAQMGDIEAERLVYDTLRSLALDLNPVDIDIIDRLRSHPDHFEIGHIASDAKRRYERIDADVIDRLQGRAAALEKRAASRSADADKAKQTDRKSAYTKAYEAAMKLPLSKRRQLAQALLDS